MEVSADFVDSYKMIFFFIQISLAIVSLYLCVSRFCNYLHSTGLMALDELHKKVLKTSKSRQDVSEWV